jgi:hypothetical protein
VKFLFTTLLFKICGITTHKVLYYQPRLMIVLATIAPVAVA